MKKWIRYTGAGFLAMMLVFTFLSRVAASVTTAMVSTQKAVSGKISHSVSVSGEVETMQEIFVTIPEERTVEEVYIRTGDQVDKGDALFRLSENYELIKAEDAFSSWEIGTLMTLETVGDAYLAAYESWKRYLAGNFSLYGKSDTDQEEDNLEEAMREAQYEYFDEYKTYLEFCAEWQEEMIGDEDASDTDVKKGRKGTLRAMKEMWAAKAAYYKFQQNREEVYQYSRSEEEMNLRETLEKAIHDYESLLITFESELTEKAGNISDVSDGLPADGMIYADAAGTVKEVNLQTGGQTDTSAFVVLAADSEQKKIIVTVSAEYEEYLAVGDSVILKKYGEAEVIQGAELADIQYEEDNTGRLALTVIITTTALKYGDQVDVTFNNQSEQYSMLVPVNAIYMQNNETYVFIVQEAEEILGTVLKAQKVNVEILDKNSSYAAISATGVSGQDIIVQSDREVKDGSRIRRQVS